MQFAKLLWGAGKHLFELAIAVGNVGKANVGGKVAKTVVGYKQSKGNLSEFVADGVVDARQANKLFEQFHQVKLAVAALLGKNANGKLFRLSVHDVEGVFHHKKLLVHCDVFDGFFVMQPMQKVLHVNKAHVGKVFVHAKLQKRLQNLWVQFVCGGDDAIHVGGLWVVECVFVVLQRAQVYKYTIKLHILLVFEGVHGKWWQHN